MITTNKLQQRRRLKRRQGRQRSAVQRTRKPRLRRQGSRLNGQQCVEEEEVIRAEAGMLGVGAEDLG